VIGAALDLRSGGLVLLSGAPGVVALAVLGLALLTARPQLLGPALAILCLVQLQRVAMTGESDLARLAAVSVGVLLVGELSQWSFDSRQAAVRERGMHVSRGLTVLVLCVLSLVAVTVVLVAAFLPVAGGAWAPAVAVLAAVGLLAMLSVAAMRGVERDQRA